jgi:glycosyltransferase involved in cell wall biosynthesis
LVAVGGSRPERRVDDMSSEPSRPILLFVVTEDWYFVSHRLVLARAAVRAGYRVVVATRVKAHGDVIAEAGCELWPLPWRRRGDGVLGHVSALRGLVGLYRHLRPDVVHHVALKPVVFGGIAARLSGTVGTVNAIAGLGGAMTQAGRLGQLKRRALRLVLRFVVGTGSAVIVQNPDDGETLVRWGIASRDQVALIRGAGVEPDEFPVAPETPGMVTVALAARMLWNKGVAEFVDAARDLRRRGVVARFVLVGEPDRDNTAAVPEGVIRRWAEEGVVEWLGRRDDMPTVLAGCHIICLPSFYGEGIPKVLIEAAAAGRPIVTTDTPGCREIVRHGENGLLVEPRNASALAAALAALIGDPSARRRMGQRGREIVEEEFGVARVVDETLSVYARIRAEAA